MWIVYSLTMFFASNAIYVCIRQAQKWGIPAPVYSVAMFGLPAVIYLLLAVTQGVTLFLSPTHLLIVLITAFFWSYLGNYLSLKAIKLAPNPGYSLILQKSYVIVTTIAAVFLFGSSLNWSKAVGILLVVAFSGLISISGKVKRSESLWIFLSLGAHLCFAFGSLMSKYFLNLGLEPYVYLMYINFFVGAANVLQVHKEKLSISLPKQHLVLLSAIGVLSVLFNLFLQFGYRVAPNPGYVVAFNTGSILSLTLISAWLFGDNLSKQKLIGIIGAFVGLLVVAFS